MQTLKVGFSRIDITPELGIDISGYFVTRIADGILDRLYANALSLEFGETKAVMIALDNLGIKQEILIKYRENRRGV